MRLVFVTPLSGHPIAVAFIGTLFALGAAACDKRPVLAPAEPTTALPRSTRLPSVPADAGDGIDGGAAGDADVDARPTSAAEEADGGVTSCANVVVHLESRGVHRGKPPLAIYTFDVELHNPATTARWLILPQTFPYDGKNVPAPGDGDVSTLEADELVGRGRVVLVSIGDRGAFRALRLPAHATVKLRSLPIHAWWTVTHETARLDVIVARAITVDRQPLEKLIQANVMSDPNADVDLASDSARGKLRVVDAVPVSMNRHAAAFDEDCRGYGKTVLKSESH